MAILEFFETILDFIVFLVDGLVQWLTMLPSTVASLMASLTYVPSVVVPFLAFAVTIAIVYTIMGR